MAGNTGKQKRKVFFSKGSLLSLMGAEIKTGAGRFTKRTRGLKAIICKNNKAKQGIELKNTW